MAFEKRDAARLDALFEEVLAEAPYEISQADSWLFVYGAMLEKPPFEAIERQVAKIDGFHRSFCLDDPALRGTEKKPGLTLGLEVGGECVGLAWRLSRQTAQEDIAAFWPVEMELPFYRAEWRDVTVDCYGRVPALVLLADPGSSLFASGLPQEDVVRRIATCVGSKGTNSDYLFEAASGLARAGVNDRDLDALVMRVKAHPAQRR